MWLLSPFTVLWHTPPPQPTVCWGYLRLLWVCRFLAMGVVSSRWCTSHCFMWPRTNPLLRRGQRWCSSDSVTKLHWHGAKIYRAYSSPGPDSRAHTHGANDDDRCVPMTLTATLLQCSWGRVMLALTRTQTYSLGSSGYGKGMFITIVSLMSPKWFIAVWMSGALLCSKQ